MAIKETEGVKTSTDIKAGDPTAIKFGPSVNLENVFGYLETHSSVY